MTPEQIALLRDGTVLRTHVAFRKHAEWLADQFRHKQIEDYLYRVDSFEPMSDGPEPPTAADSEWIAAQIRERTGLVRFQHGRFYHNILVIPTQLSPRGLLRYHPEISLEYHVMFEGIMECGLALELPALPDQFVEAYAIELHKLEQNNRPDEYSKIRYEDLARTPEGRKRVDWYRERLRALWRDIRCVVAGIR